MAYVLKVDGSTETLPNTQLETLQQAVGGYIEIVPIAGNKLMVVNEEGKIEGLPVNRAATAIAVQTMDDIIVGDVVIADESEID